MTDFDPENPDLEDALDGLIAAVNYTDEIGCVELSNEIAELYQRLGGMAPSEHWENSSPTLGTWKTQVAKCRCKNCGEEWEPEFDTVSDLVGEDPEACPECGASSFEFADISYPDTDYGDVKERTREIIEEDRELFDLLDDSQTSEE